MSDAPIVLHLSLISHTNVGKTTLARTLLRRDIGEVRDEAHVTELAEEFDLISTQAGDSLRLWDTPGFGDTGRLLKRLRQLGNPIGWLLSQVWDRYTDRPFWSTQQAIRNVREHADVVLYLVNAGEDPGTAAYVDVEMQILAWIGKPIVLLLNQIGPQRSQEQEAAELERWRSHVKQIPLVRAVLALDAFARCWVQEHILLEQVEELLPAAARDGSRRLRQAWKNRNLDIFVRSMKVLALQIAATAADRETIPTRSIKERARAWLGQVAIGAERGDPALERAMTLLAGRLDLRIRNATQSLIELHGLSGQATREILTRLGGEFSVEQPLDAGKASVIGALVSGAMGGLAADLAASGLTFGAGALIGGVLGALGAGGLTTAYNVARGTDTSLVRWSPGFLSDRVTAAIVRYLAVAHFGRGRGEFVTGEFPPLWGEMVTAAVAVEREVLYRTWRRLQDGAPVADLAAELEPVLRLLTGKVLTRLYPQAATIFEEAGSGGEAASRGRAP